MKLESAILLAGIQTWVEIESPTSDKHGVNRMMSFAAAECAKYGAEVKRHPGTGGFGDHLEVQSQWGGEAKGILVLCHLDTVHPVGTIGGPLPFRVEGDKAFGPGIYDMKGGAYLAHAALASIATEGKTTPLPVRLLYVSDEETGSQTSRKLIEAAADKAKYVLVVEPARDGGKIVVARKGVGRYDIRATGRAAHSGAQHQDGRSAIREICNQVERLESMTDYARGITINIGQISGGTADNVVPQFCEATIDLRVKTIADAQMMDAAFKSLKSFNPDVKIEVTGDLNRPPYEETAGGRALFDHTKSLAKSLNIDLVGVATGGGSDGNFVAHKVPTLDGLGVDGAGAHTHNEHALVSSFVPRATLLRRLYETLS